METKRLAASEKNAFGNPLRKSRYLLSRGFIGSRGFTLMEILIMMLCISILAAVSIPKINSLVREAKTAAEKQVVGNIKIGINTYYIESSIQGRKPLYPAVLDTASVAAASITNPFFTNVLALPAVTNIEWKKLNSILYQGPSGRWYFYEPSTGAFKDTILIDDSILSLLGLSREDVTVDMITQLFATNVITFSDGKKLVGGSAVILPKPPGEPAFKGNDTGQETYTFSSGTVTASIVAEYAGYAPQMTFGYYVKDPATGQKVLHQLFNGPDSAGAKKTFPTNTSEIVGFYITTPQGKGYTYYSETGSNPDGKDHMKVYMNPTTHTITIGCEDLYGGGDGDFQDFIVTVAY